MFLRRMVRFAMSSERSVSQRIPKAPKLLSGELESFRMEGEHARIFDGYSLDELYGSKIGHKHAPAVLAQMRKDTIVSVGVFVVGCAIIWHLYQLDKQNLKQLEDMNDRRRSRSVTLPEGLTNNLKPNNYRNEVHTV